MDKTIIDEIQKAFRNSENDIFQMELLEKFKLMWCWNCEDKLISQSLKLDTNNQYCDECKIYNFDSSMTEEEKRNKSLKYALSYLYSIDNISINDFYNEQNEIHGYCDYCKQSFTILYSDYNGEDYKIYCPFCKNAIQDDQTFNKFQWEVEQSK